MTRRSEGRSGGAPDSGEVGSAASRTVTPDPMQKEKDLAPVQAPPARKERRWRAAVPGLVPWAMFVVAVAAAVLFAVLWRGAQGNDRRRAQVASTTQQFLTALTNFKGTTIDADVARIRGYAVGDFAGQVGTFFNQTATTALRQAQAVSRGQVQSVFVESLSGSSASAFGLVDVSVTNSATTTSSTEVLRVEVELIDTSTGWKVERVNILQSPNSTSPFAPSTSP